MAKFSKKSLITAIKAWICLILILILIIGIGYYKTLPVIKIYAKSVAETVMLNSANDAVIAILDEQKISYDEIAKLSRAEDGTVKSLEVDVYKINNLKSRISNQIAKIISDREEYSVSIPIGSFFNTPYTSGIGPRIPFKLKITTTTFVDFGHEFKSAGINQVLHLIYVNIKVRGNFVASWYSSSVTVETKTIAAQTVIVGATPEAFTNVIESVDDNTAGLINDYGALAGE